MATGQSNQLTKQVGEYLVASELARRGFIAATFSGNVPHFDLVVTDSRGSSCPVQVKTIKGGSWQFSADKFAEIPVDDDGRQTVRKKTLPSQKYSSSKVSLLAGRQNKPVTAEARRCCHSRARFSMWKKPGSTKCCLRLR